MSYVRCIFSASKDMTINIKLFPIYSNSYGHAYDAMFAHDIAATFPSDRVRVCGEFRRHSLCVCVCSVATAFLWVTHKAQLPPIF